MAGQPPFPCARPLAARAFARTAAYDAAISTWFAQRRGRAEPGEARDRGQARRGAPLRREPASIGRLLSHRREALRRRHRDAAARQGALLQQSQRHRRGLRARRRIRCKRKRGNRHHQARQSVRRGARRDPRRGLRQGARLRSGERFRRHRRGEPPARCRGRARDRQDLHRGHHRARRERRGKGDLAEKKTLRLPACRRAARSEGGGPHLPLALRRLPRARARQRRGLAVRSQGRDQAEAEPSQNSPTSSSPSPWRSTSSRTPSSMREPAPRSASERGRCHASMLRAWRRGRRKIRPRRGASAQA